MDYHYLASSGKRVFRGFRESNLGPGPVSPQVATDNEGFLQGEVDAGPVVTSGPARRVLGDPLFILIVLAIYRIILEFFVVTFRVAEDIRALRERGDLR
jgi:hypothetical protein